MLNTLINTFRVDVFYNNYTSVEAQERGAIVDPYEWMDARHGKYFKDARKPTLQFERLLKRSASKKQSHA